VPALYAALLVAAERRGRAEHRLRVAISGGSPLALELGKDPRIRSVEVATRPDAVKESEILLRITPTMDGAITEAEVRELCKARLAAFKQPERIHFAPLDASTGSGVEPIFEKPATERENHEGE
jgi:hypothetical protein